MLVEFLELSAKVRDLGLTFRFLVCLGVDLLPCRRELALELLSLGATLGQLDRELASFIEQSFDPFPVALAHFPRSLFGLRDGVLRLHTQGVQRFRSFGLHRGEGLLGLRLMSEKFLFPRHPQGLGRRLGRFRVEPKTLEFVNAFTTVR